MFWRTAIHIKETMKKLIYLFIFSITLHSCLDMNDPELQAEYIMALKTYNSSLTKHIPPKIPNNQIGYGFSFASVDSYSSFYIRTIEKKDKYYSIKEKYINESKSIVSSKDTSIVVYESIDKLIDSLKLDNKIFNYKVVPQELYVDYTEYYTSKLIDYKFDIIMLDSKFDSLPSKIDYVKLESNDGALANNFFRGVAFYDNDLVITYWVITW